MSKGLSIELVFFSPYFNGAILPFQTVEDNLCKPFGVKRIINLIDYTKYNNSSQEPLKFLFSQLTSCYRFDDLSLRYSKINRLGPSYLQFRKRFEEDFFNDFYKCIHSCDDKVGILVPSGTYIRSSRGIASTRVLDISSYLFDYHPEILVSHLVKYNGYGVKRITNRSLFLYGNGNTLFYLKNITKSADYLRKILNS